MSCILCIDDYGRKSYWENCVRVALESAGDISITYNDGSDNESYYYTKGYVYYNGSEIEEGWEWRDDGVTSEIAIAISDKIEPPKDPDNTDDSETPTNPSTPSTAIIRYFFKSSGDPADYTDYVGDGSYTKTINHYGLSLVAGSTTTITLTYYTDSEQSETGTYSITSPKTGYLLYNIVSLPELGQEDYKKVDYDIKVYCFKAPTITVAYTSTPDTLFGEPATIFVQPEAYGKVGSFVADWGMIGGMAVTTSFNVNSGYKFLNWTIEKGGTTETNTANKYKYTVKTYDDVTITANFERLPAVTLQVNPSTAGVVNPSAGVKTPTDNDYKIKLTASPNENYKFDKWTKNSATISTAQEYTYTATKGENTTITANFSSTTQPDTPDTPEEPDDGRIATQSDVATKSNYVFEIIDDENRCPTKSEINSRSNNIANINNIYTDIQCVKYTDVVFNAININCKIKTSIVAFVKTPCVEIFRGNAKFSTLQTASSTDDMNVYNDKSSTTAIDCTYLNDSSSPDAVLKVRVYNTNWGGNRVITVTCNGVSKQSSQTKDFTAIFDTIYFKDFLRNKYDINVVFDP